MPGDWQAFIEPQVRQFLDYWESRRRGRGRMPGRPNLDPADIPGLLPGVFLVDILLSGSGLRFRYRLLGTDHTEIYGADLTGSYVDEALHPPWCDAVLDSYSKAALTGEPDLLRAPVARHGRHHISVTSAVAPLSSDGTTVDMLFGYAKVLPS